jgi:hypothetical protein
MIRPALAALLGVVSPACQTSGPGSGPAGPGETHVERLAVTFEILDSYSYSGLSGATVLAADRQGVTDEGGRVTLEVPVGTLRAHASATGYDPGEITRAEVAGTAAVQILLVPAAPLVTRCRMADGLLHALATDLAGRKTILRHARSEVTLHGPEFGSVTVSWLHWSWKAVDDWTYQVSVPLPSGEVISAAWWVYDRDLNVRQVSCDPRPESTDL